MKKILIMVLLTVALNLFATKYAGEIFSIGAGIKNYALGGTGLTNEKSTALAYWNPALLGQSDRGVELMHAEEFSGLMQFDTFSSIFGKNNAYSVVLTRIAINDIPLTKWDEEYNRPYKYKSVTTSDMVGYFGFKTTYKNFKIGFTPKVAYRKLANESGFGFGADVSTFYKFSKKFMLAGKLKDCFTTQILWTDSKKETVYPSLVLEGKYSFVTPVIKKQMNFYLSSDVLAENRKFSSTVHLGSLSMDFHAGLETIVSDKLLLYLGYDVSNFTGGLTVLIGKFNINYAFEQNSELNNSHRISIGYRL